MAIKTHHYTNGEITILWQPALCIHSGICFKGLPQVFDPRRKPWIEMGEIDTAVIFNQVRKCPSGAISIIVNSSGYNEEK
jgi:uncharacterized Fe-S cluster protein YjdI